MNPDTPPKTRRSSILKSSKPNLGRSPLQNVEVNQDPPDEDRTTVTKTTFKRRVSFSRTTKVQEFQNPQAPIAQVWGEAYEKEMSPDPMFSKDMLSSVPNVGSGLQKLLSCQINKSAFTEVISCGTVTTETSHTTVSSQTFQGQAGPTGDDDMDITNPNISITHVPRVDKENLATEQKSQLATTSADQMKNLYALVNFEVDDYEQSPNHKCLDMLNQTRIEDDSDMSMSSSVADFSSNQASVSVKNAYSQLIDKSIKFLNPTMDLPEQCRKEQTNCSNFASSVSMKNGPCISDDVPLKQLQNTNDLSNQLLIETTQPNKESLQTNANFSLFDPPTSNTDSRCNEPSLFKFEPIAKAERSLDFSSSTSFLLGASQPAQFGQKIIGLDTLTNQQTFTASSELGFTNEDLESNSWPGESKVSNTSAASIPPVCKPQIDILQVSKPASFLFGDSSTEKKNFIYPKDDIFTRKATEELLRLKRSKDLSQDSSASLSPLTTANNSTSSVKPLQVSCSPKKSSINALVQEPSFEISSNQLNFKVSASVCMNDTIGNVSMETSCIPKSSAAPPSEGSTESSSSSPIISTVVEMPVVKSLDKTLNESCMDITRAQNNNSPVQISMAIKNEITDMDITSYGKSQEFLSDSLCSNEELGSALDKTKHACDMDITSYTKSQDTSIDYLPSMDTTLPVNQEESPAMQANKSVCMALENSVSLDKTTHVTDIDITCHAKLHEKLNESLPLHTSMGATLQVDNEKFEAMQTTIGVTQKDNESLDKTKHISDMDITGVATHDIASCAKSFDKTNVSLSSMETTLPISKQAMQANKSTCLVEENSGSPGKTKLMSDMDMTCHAKPQVMLNNSLILDATSLMETTVPVHQESFSAMKPKEMMQDNTESLNQTKHTRDMDLTCHVNSQKELNVSLPLITPMETTLPINHNKTKHLGDMDVTCFEKSQKELSVLNASMETTLPVDHNKTKRVSDMDITCHVKSQEEVNVPLPSNTSMETNLPVDHNKTTHLGDMDVSCFEKSEKELHVSLPLNTSLEITLPAYHNKTKHLGDMDVACFEKSQKELSVLNASIETTLPGDHIKTKQVSDMDITCHVKSQEEKNMPLPSNTSMEITLPVDHNKTKHLGDMDVTCFEKSQKELSVLNASMETTLPVDHNKTKRVNDMDITCRVKSQEKVINVPLQLNTSMETTLPVDHNKTKRVSDMDITCHVKSQEKVNVPLQLNTSMETTLPVDHNKTKRVSDMDITCHVKSQEKVNVPLQLNTSMETTLPVDHNKTKRVSDMDITCHVKSQEKVNVPLQLNTSMETTLPVDHSKSVANIGLTLGTNESLNKTKHVSDMDITTFANTHTNLPSNSSTFMETTLSAYQQISPVIQENKSTCVLQDKSLNKTEGLSDMDIACSTKPQENINIPSVSNTAAKTIISVNQEKAESIEATNLPENITESVNKNDHMSDVQITCEIKPQETPLNLSNLSTNELFSAHSTESKTTGASEELHLTKLSDVTRSLETQILDETNHQVATAFLHKSDSDYSEETDKINEKHSLESPEADKDEIAFMNLTKLNSPIEMACKTLPPEALNKTSCVDTSLSCTDLSLTLSQPSQELISSQTMNNSFETDLQPTDVSTRSMNQTFVVQTKVLDAEDKVVCKESHTQKYTQVSTPNLSKSVNFEKTHSQNNLLNEKCDITSLEIVENIRANSSTQNVEVTKLHITDDIEDVLIDNKGTISHKMKHLDITKTVETSPSQEIENMSVSTQVQLNSTQELLLSTSDQQLIERPNIELSPLKYKVSVSPTNKSTSGEFKRSSEWFEENVKESKKSCLEEHQPAIPKITITTSTPCDTFNYSSPQSQKSPMSDSVDMELEDSPKIKTSQDGSIETCEMEVEEEIVTPKTNSTVNNFTPQTDNSVKSMEFDSDDLVEPITSQQILTKKRKSGTYESPITEGLISPHMQHEVVVTEESEASPKKLIKLSPEKTTLPAKEILLISIEEPSTYEGPSTISDYIKELSKSTRHLWRIVHLESKQWTFEILQGTTHLCIEFGEEEGTVSQVIFRPNAKVMAKLLKGKALAWQFCFELLNRRFPESALLEQCSCAEKVPELLTHLSPVLTGLSNLGRGLAHSASNFIMEFSFKNCYIQFSARSLKLLMMMRVRLDLSNWEQLNPKNVSVHVTAGKIDTSPIPGLLVNLPHDWQMIPKYIEEVREYVKVLEQFVSKN